MRYQITIQTDLPGYNKLYVHGEAQTSVDACNEALTLILPQLEVEAEAQGIAHNAQVVEAILFPKGT